MGMHASTGFAQLEALRMAWQEPMYEAPCLGGRVNEEAGVLREPEAASGLRTLSQDESCAVLLRARKAPQLRAAQGIAETRRYAACVEQLHGSPRRIPLYHCSSMHGASSLAHA